MLESTNSTTRFRAPRARRCEYDRVQDLVGGILDDALAEIAARLDTRGEGTPLVVYNSLAWARGEPVRLTLRLNAPPKHLAIRNADGVAMPTQTLAVQQKGHYWHADIPFLARDVPSLG